VAVEVTACRRQGHIVAASLQAAQLVFFLHSFVYGNEISSSFMLILGFLFCWVSKIILSHLRDMLLLIVNTVKI